jgi:type IV secretory pathway TraG/TraD family ATPase VirD4
METKSNQPNEWTLVWIGGTILLLAFWKRIEIPVLTFWGRSDVRIGFALLLGTLFSGILLYAFAKTEKARERKKRENAILGNAPDAVYCGKSRTGVQVFIKTKQRSMHTQVIGTTSAGKTESVILPWAIQDIAQKRGLILIDGKADRSLLDKLYAYTTKYGRLEDFRLISLSLTELSHQFNPLIGGTAEEIAERVFNAFEFENEYFRSIQFEVFSQVLRIFEAKKNIPTFRKIHQAISQPNLLGAMVRDLPDASLRTWVDVFRDLPVNERMQRTSGLLAALSHFSFGKVAPILNAEVNSVTIDDALRDGKILYFQLPVLLSPFLGRATGKMILQCLQSAVANRHRSGDRNPKFFSVFLDDFSEYLYPGFVSILNKSRSANVGIVFAHQALGDIQTLGDAVANSILTNANIKVFMRGNDPDSAEYFSRVIGTEKSMKFTERTKKEFFGRKGTGDESAREVEEFSIHPNQFKRDMGVGEGIMLVPHNQGTKSVRMQFAMFPDLDPIDLPIIEKPLPGSIALHSEKPINEKIQQGSLKRCSSSHDDWTRLPFSGEQLRNSK